MNQIEARVLPLADFMDRPEGWGRSQGREVYQRLLGFVEENPGVGVFRISMHGVQRMDISFSSEAIVELARRFRRIKGFCLTDVTDSDLLENIDAACVKKDQPMLVMRDRAQALIGPSPSEGTREAFEFAMKHPEVRASELVIEKDISLPNASMKLKRLWDQGFLLRNEAIADTGGVEYRYRRIT